MSHFTIYLDDISVLEIDIRYFKIEHTLTHFKHAHVEGVNKRRKMNELVFSPQKKSLISFERLLIPY